MLGQGVFLHKFLHFFGVTTSVTLALFKVSNSSSTRFWASLQQNLHSLQQKLPSQQNFIPYWSFKLSSVSSLSSSLSSLPSSSPTFSFSSILFLFCTFKDASANNSYCNTPYLLLLFNLIYLQTKLFN